MTLDSLLRDVIRETVREVVREELRAQPAPAEHAPEKPREIMTVTDVARLLDVAQTTVRGWIRDGDLRAVRANRTVRVRREDLEGFLRSSEPVEAGELERKSDRIVRLFQRKG